MLVERGLAESRTRAQALVLAGSVYSGEQRLEKPGQQVDASMALKVRGRDHPWVSRGGVKLDHGLDHFAIEVAERTCLDIGASTGGFTHVLLSRGVASVYAVDVGRGQLDWTLRRDPRVVSLERTNARHLISEQIPEAPAIITCDASFIGLRTVLPAALALAAPGCVLVALIKPQFEVTRDQVGKGGVVRDPALHQEVCREISGWLAGKAGWRELGLTKSPLKGPRGNTEYLIAAVLDDGNGEN